MTSHRLADTGKVAQARVPLAARRGRQGDAREQGVLAQTLRRPTGGASISHRSVVGGSLAIGGSRMLPAKRTPTI